MPSREITDCVKEIQDVWPTIKAEFIRQSPGKYLQLTTTHRSPAEQFQLYQQGREQLADGTWAVSDKSKVVTNVDGIKVLGAHNYFPSRAIDVAVVDNQTGKYLWAEVHYQCLGEIAKRVSLTWGGNWKSFKDMPHLEIPDYKNYVDKSA